MSQSEKKDYLDLEDHILDQFSTGEKFIFQGNEFKVILSGKPVVAGGGGEPKTDVYVKANSIDDSSSLELKISIKMKKSKKNIFLGNKIPKKRAIQIFGKQWHQIIVNSIQEIKDILEKSNPIDRSKKKVLLGWRFDILNSKSGQRSGKIHTSTEIIEEIYSGKNLESRKKDAVVSNQVVLASGIANFVLEVNKEDINNSNDVITNLISIKQYVKKNNEIYFALKALNLRFSASKSPKWDGDRPLVVYVKYCAKNDILKWKIVLDEPYVRSGNIVAQNALTEISKLSKPLFLDVRLE